MQQRPRLAQQCSSFENWKVKSFFSDSQQNLSQVFAIHPKSGTIQFGIEKQALKSSVFLGPQFGYTYRRVGFGRLNLEWAGENTVDKRTIGCWDPVSQSNVSKFCKSLSVCDRKIRTRNELLLSPHCSLQNIRLEVQVEWFDRQARFGWSKLRFSGLPRNKNWLPRNKLISGKYRNSPIW